MDIQQLRALSKRFAESTGICPCNDPVCQLVDGAGCDFTVAGEVLAIFGSLNLLTEFLAFISKQAWPQRLPIGYENYIEIGWILDTTGLLLQEAVNFMEGRK